jgi:hypothetical protein
MNKMPLPTHLLADIPGFAMLGQTSFGGYWKIILTWWHNGCPNVFEHHIEWCSLSGMYQRDYDRHKSKIEPLLMQSIEILKQYRDEQKAKKAYLSESARRMTAKRMENQAKRRKGYESKGNIVDKVTPVNPAPAIPSPKPFHEGWNLERQKSPNINKKTTHRPMLLDK